MEVFIVLLIISGILGWIVKVILKRRLEKGLGRKAEDHELTSISSWMAASPADKKPPEDRNSSA